MECVAAATWVVGQKTQQVKSLQVLRKLNVDMQVSFQMFSFCWTWLLTVPLGRHISWSLCGAGLPQNHSKSTGIENSKRRSSDNPLQSTTTTCRWPQVCLRSPDCHSRSHRLQLLWFRSDAGCWRHPDLPSGIMVCHQSGSSLKSWLPLHPGEINPVHCKAQGQRPRIDLMWGKATTHSCCQWFENTGCVYVHQAQLWMLWVDPAVWQRWLGNLQHSSWYNRLFLGSVII